MVMAANSDTTAPIGRKLYHLQFWLQAASPETFGYTPYSPDSLYIRRGSRNMKHSKVFLVQAGNLY
jgi:hypothetical protein